MSLLISSRFDSRELADRAMMRLRQNGVAFTLVNISPAQIPQSALPLSPAAMAMEPFSFNITNQVGILTNGFEPLFESKAYRLTGRGETITLKISDAQYDKARQVLDGSNAKDIKTL